jgi:hypothetical protein
MKWQPIDTAPKDRAILVFEPYWQHRITSAIWDDKAKHFRSNCYAYIEMHATHWMELPEPPKGADNVD